MRRLPIALFLVGSGLVTSLAQTRVITVTTADNVNPPSGQTSLLQALTNLQDGDEIRFNLPGAGPHFIETPPDGYPLVTRNGVRLDGYSQPGSAPNSSPILAANNARIRVVLDSRNGNSRLLDFPGDQPNDVTGYGNTQSAVLGVVGATGFELRGVSLLGVPLTGPDQGVEMYGVAFGKGASGQVRGCWVGVAPDGVTVAGPSAGVVGLEYQVRDAEDQWTQSILVDDVVVGVAAEAATPRADFNVLAGIARNPILLEGERIRIAGNFLGVLPDGLHDVNLTLDPAFAGAFAGFIRVGRAGNNTLIGTDGDGVNDADERNVFGGALPTIYGGCQQSIEFYAPNPGTNVVLAGNLVGVAVDLATPFTNGVPVLNAAGDRAVYRFGSNVDGLSDELEGNRVFNHWPDSLFNTGYFDTLYPNALNFFSELSLGGTVSARGNSLVNNLPFPSSPTRWDGPEPGAWLTNFYAPALVSAADGIRPVLDGASTPSAIRGAVPRAQTAFYPVTWLDLYVADPAGMATGEELQLPELPYGFVQGRTFLGSFQVDGAQDQDPAAGAFEFDIRSLGLTDALLTVTANYSTGTGSPAGVQVLTSPFSDPVRVVGKTDELEFTSITRTAQGVRLEWTGGGTLQLSDALGGGWDDVAGAASPYTTPVSDARGFFRLRR